MENGGIRNTFQYSIYKFIKSHSFHPGCPPLAWVGHGAGCGQIPEEKVEEKEQEQEHNDDDDVTQLTQNAVRKTQTD